MSECVCVCMCVHVCVYMCECHLKKDSNALQQLLHASMLWLHDSCEQITSMTLHTFRGGKFN